MDEEGEKGEHGMTVLKESKRDNYRDRGADDPPFDDKVVKTILYQELVARPRDSRRFSPALLSRIQARLGIINQLRRAFMMSALDDPRGIHQKFQRMKG